MSKILAVFGATGIQGGSLIKYVLRDSELSQRYKIRAITRDVNSENAKKLSDVVEVVQGDALDKSSLITALSGVNTVFAMTTPAFTPNAVEDEFNVGKTIADAAVESGVNYFIFSTLPSPLEFTKGKYTKVTPFDAKAKIEQYVRTLPIKSAFYSPAFFMQNFATQPFLGPRKDENGVWTLRRSTSSKALYPYIDATGNTGNFIGAILADPEKYKGKTLCAAQGFYTMDEIVAILTKTSAQDVVYKQLSREEMRNTLPFAPELFDEGLAVLEDFGYWGVESEALVAEGLGSVRGKLTTLEEYLTENPLQLV